jgi:outer membrane receptor protein involved in Fe transport
VRNGIGILASVLLLFLTTLPLAAQATGQVAGQITNANTGEPLAGAQIAIQGTTIGTMANPQGRYLILNVPVGTHTIEVTRLGFAMGTLQVTVGAGETAVADFALRTEAINLDELVVTGTAGSARRREIGNTVGVISSDDLEAQPITSVTDVLQAKTPGLTITSMGGNAGSGSEIMLRGVNTLGDPNDNYPLVYVDGVRMEMSYYGSSGESNTRASAFDNLDPASIDRIEVIKGAAATTLYGTEAAGGVIQVFTKNGGGGSARWTFTTSQGFSDVGHVGPEEDPTGIHMNDCSMDPGCPSSGSWLRKGYIQEYNLQVQGGTEVPYFFAASIGDQRGNIEPQGATDMSFRGNFRFEPLDNLTIRSSNMFTRRDITFVPDGNNAEGLILNVMRWENDYTPGHDDSAVLNMDIRQQIDHFISGVQIQWSPSASLNHRLNVGLDYQSADYTEERPWQHFYQPEGNRENDLEMDRNITADYAGTWSTDLRVPLLDIDLSSDLSWGAQYYDEFSWGVYGYGENFSGPGEKLVESGTYTEANESWTRTASGGFFAQEQFGWNDRLFVTLGGRWDGFSTFGENFGLAFYPKVSAAYTISDHDFWPSWWETMKLRGALGESGRAPAPFASNRTWTSSGAASDDGQPGLILSELGNEDVGPERTLEAEGGFEASLFDGRLSLDFTYFKQTTTDALLRLDRPASIGTEQAILTNLGKVENAGFELAANASLISSSDFSFDLGGNFYHGEDEVVSLGPVTDERLKGRPVSAQFGDCVTNPDEFARPDFEECYQGTARPTTTFGITPRLTFFGNLTLEGLGEYQGGHIKQNGTARQNIRRDFWATCQDVIDAINLDRDNEANYTAAELAKCSPRDANYGAWTMAGDFFRIRSLVLSYRLPESLLPNQIGGLTLRLQGRNLWYWTKYEDGDPETHGYTGATGSWYATSRDYYGLPVPRVFLFSATVNF